jgi:hypothetical protein
MCVSKVVKVKSYTRTLCTPCSIYCVASHDFYVKLKKVETNRIYMNKYTNKIRKVNYCFMLRIVCEGRIHSHRPDDGGSTHL